MILRFISSVYVQIFIAIMMMLSSLQELFLAVEEVGAHHGVFLYSIYLMLKGLSDLLGNTNKFAALKRNPHSFDPK